ncbi:unnamed protein product [Owenia fusiformis]|uniref:Uncharacterized protein n=1 Tax=Owenia fusiformis TaxID=6347 RepID=A0A8J1XRF5_OWEFU|nr:unnamed protein product [Owenia fusiformis]
MPICIEIWRIAVGLFNYHKLKMINAPDSSSDIPGLYFRICTLLTLLLIGGGLLFNIAKHGTLVFTFLSFIIIFAQQVFYFCLVSMTCFYVLSYVMHQHSNFSLVVIKLFLLVLSIGCLPGSVLLIHNPSHISRILLMLCGDVEINPGPVDDLKILFCNINSIKADSMGRLEFLKQYAKNEQFHIIIAFFMLIHRIVLPSFNGFLIGFVG